MDAPSFWAGFIMGAAIIGIISWIVLQNFKYKIEYLQDLLKLGNDDYD